MLNAILLFVNYNLTSLKVNRSSDCPPESIYIRNCSLYGWEVDAEFVFSGVNLTKITLSSTASLDYGIDGSKINVTLAYVQLWIYLYLNWFTGLVK